MFASAPLIPRLAESLRSPNTGTLDACGLKTLIGRGHQVLNQTQRNHSALVEGHFLNVTLRDGLSMHCTDILQLQDMATQIDMREEGLKVLIKLEGNADVFMDDHALPFAATSTAPVTAQGALVALSGPATFRRYAKTGARQRMVVLTIDPGWLDAAQISVQNTLQHLAMQRWTPSPRAIALTEQLLHPSGLDGMLERLHQECRAVELIAEALGHLLLPPDPACAPLTASALARVRRLQQLLDSEESAGMDLQGIAQTIGCNPTTLQQQFRQLHGQTIFDYLRAQRLQRAANALIHRGVSVAEAAEIAGYSSPANFSTAYRKHFGMSPKRTRNRL